MALEASELAAQRATWSRPPGLARYPEQLAGEAQKPEIVQNFEVEAVALTKIPLVTMGRSEHSDVAKKYRSKGNGMGKVKVERNEEDEVKIRLIQKWNENFGKPTEKERWALVTMKRPELEKEFVKFEMLDMCKKVHTDRKRIEQFQEG